MREYIRMAPLKRPKTEKETIKENTRPDDIIREARARVLKEFPDLADLFFVKHVVKLPSSVSVS